MASSAKSRTSSARLVLRMARFILAGTFMCCLKFAIAATPANAQETGPSVDDLTWLTGCWVMSAEGLSIEEYWMPPSGGTMLGMNRTVRERRTTGYELMLIRETDSKLFLEAHPSGQASAVFEATSSNAERVVFENPQHDFPRRISYVRLGADSLRAEIDDGEGGKVIEFPYRRATCGH